MTSLSAGLLKVENLTVTGTQAGSVQATNFNFTNLNLSGDLVVGYQNISGNYQNGNLTANGLITANSGLVVPQTYLESTYGYTTLTSNGQIYSSGSTQGQSFTSNIIQQSNNFIIPEQIIDSELDTSGVYTVTVLLNTAAWNNTTFSRVLMDNNIQVPLTIRISFDGSLNKVVTVQIPDITFTLDASGVYSTGSIQTPMNAFIDASGNANGAYGGGFVYTVPGYNLPKNIWPQSLLGAPVDTSGSDGHRYIWNILADGSLTLSSGDNWNDQVPNTVTIPFCGTVDGPRTIQGVSINYTILKSVLKPPINMRLSSGLSMVNDDYIDYVYGGLGYGDYNVCRNKLIDTSGDPNFGKVFSIWVWLDNSTAPTFPRNTLYLNSRTAYTDPLTGITVYNPIVPIVTSDGVYDEYGNLYTILIMFCSTVSIDPTNYKHLSVSSSFDFGNGNCPLAIWESWDAAQTWNTNPLFPLVDVKLFSGADPTTTIDSLGNVYCVGQTLNDYPYDVYPIAHKMAVIDSSSNGYARFIQINAPIEPEELGLDVLNPLSYNDNIVLTPGPWGDNSNDVALWLTANNAVYDAEGINCISIPTFVGFFKVTGKIDTDSSGNPTNISPFHYINSFIQGTVPDPSTYQNLGGDTRPVVDTSSGAFYLYTGGITLEQGIGANPLLDGNFEQFYYCPGGAASCLTDSSNVIFDTSRNAFFINGCSAFGPQVITAFHNHSRTEPGNGGGGLYNAVKWSRSRGTPPNTFFGVGVDYAHNRLISLSFDERPAGSGKGYISLNHTPLRNFKNDTSPIVWSTPQIINNVPSEIGHVCLDVEPNTGVCTISWYDPRNSIDGCSVDRYGTVFIPN